jgi:hypothetical protein
LFEARSREGILRDVEEWSVEEWSVEGGRVVEEEGWEREGGLEDGVEGGIWWRRDIEEGC